MDNLSTDPIGMKSFIAARERAIQRIADEISEETERVKNSDYAIVDLEVAIPEAKQALKLEEDSHTSLLELQAHLQKVEGSQATSPHSRGQSVALSRFRAQMARPTSRSLPSIETEVKVKTKQIQEMRSSIREMEAELINWKQMWEISSSLVHHLSSLKVVEEGALSKAKFTMRTIGQVSDEIWIRIFEMVVFIDFRDYFKLKTRRPIAFKLSQVCRNWRKLVTADQGLWRPICEPMLQTFEWDNTHFARCYLERTSTFATLCHPSGFGWLALFVDPLNPNGMAKISSDYTDIKVDYSFLHYDINMDQEPTPNKDIDDRLPNEIVKTMILSSRQPFVDKYLDIPSGFTAIEALGIVNSRPELKVPMDLLSMCPKLTKLAFRVKIFAPAFKIAGFLIPTLQELYIRNEDVYTLSLDIPETIFLPNLSTLGITISASALLKNIQARSLRTLILYGSNGLENLHPSMTESIKTVIRQLSRLEFHDWEAPGAAAMVFRNTVPEATMLHFIKFLRCHIDGGSLIVTLNNLNNAVEKSQVPNLEEITLSNIAGITNDQCERLKPLVRKLNIYV